jgi:hypothetical protein
MYWEEGDVEEHKSKKALVRFDSKAQYGSARRSTKSKFSEVKNS